MNTFTIDWREPGKPFNRFWEECVGSCHAYTALREDWRQQMRRCRDELGFRYVRFHGLFTEQMGVLVGQGEQRQYSFHNIDSIYDFLLSIGMKPFIELGFMPAALASGEQTCFHYRGNITPPKSQAEWGELIDRLARHLVARYGLAEVRQWFFEVWNEPNLDYFWTGGMDGYFRLYETTARAIKAVDAGLRVGGPATARDGWIPELIEYCRAKDVPLDYIATHQYPTDVALGHWQDMEARMAKAERGILAKLAARSRQQAGGLPLYYTEWSSSPSCRDRYHDEPYAAAFIVKTLADVDGLVEAYSYWTFSDIFEEMAHPATPFHGSFGMLNLHGIPKPSYRAFELLHRLGDRRLAVSGPTGSTVEALACRNGNVLQVLFTNHQIPRAPVATEEIVLELPWPSGAKAPYVSLRRIDDGHANAKGAWVAMGSPEYPSAQELEAIRKASEVIVQTVSAAIHGQSLQIRLVLPPQGVAMVELPLTEVSS